MEKSSIIKQSSTIRELLKKRIDELGLSYTQIAAEAGMYERSNVKIETLSRYFNKASRNALTEESIVYMCYRYGIPIRLTIGTPEKVEKGKVLCSLPKYNEAECIESVRKIFSNGKK